MSKDSPIATYVNKDGLPVDIATGKVLSFNKDGSVDSRVLNLTPELREKGLKAAHEADYKTSAYTGDGSGINWEKFFKKLKESPMLVGKAAVSANFTMQGVRVHLSKNKALQERFDLIQESNLDEHENNIYKLANLPITDESKSLPTILRANETALNAHAKNRGYGVKQGINIEGSAVQININHDMVMPGQKDPNAIEEAEVVKES